MSGGRGGNVIDHNLFVLNNHLYDINEGRYEVDPTGSNMTVTSNSLTDALLTGADTLPHNLYRGAWINVGGWFLPCDSNSQ